MKCMKPPRVTRNRLNLHVATSFTRNACDDLTPQSQPPRTLGFVNVTAVADRSVQARLMD
eukprot:6468665-Prymnesium_polylepis.2